MWSHRGTFRTPYLFRFPKSMRPFLSGKAPSSQKDLKCSSPNPKEAQRENLFHSRCLVQEKWINETGDMSVKEQVLVPLSIGSYEDEILCDVLPMDAGHIIWEGLGNLIGE
ncbi:unnamed protein product [Microthlaspi erraticum]|uniref:Uncharacterized protein n=1 Tax=Microthlaspi erraticum TaxID=1685480 RepID=A0A6D2HY24_9BRAS|nr:unnamed protein product [Microthlaspi erraticum]